MIATRGPDMMLSFTSYIYCCCWCPHVRADYVLAKMLKKAPEKIPTVIWYKVSVHYVV